jgi:flagellar hook protein FlgE
MSSVPAIAVSGMQAAQLGLRAAAHNIANGSTDGFRRQTVVAETAPAGGVTTRLAQADVAGPALETDLVGSLQARHAFLANLAVFRTSDRMTGSLLDALA